MPALIVMTVIAVGALAQELADYRHFKNVGIFDPAVSAAAANALVREGIASDDPAVVDFTIHALGGHAAFAVHDLQTAFASPPVRTFYAIPALKPFLIEYWREHHRRSGYDTHAAIQRGFGSVEETAGHGGLTVESLGLPEEATPDEIVDAVEARIPAWTRIPEILCVIYPEDGDVLDVLWEIANVDVSADSTLKTLMLLNIGRFATPDVNAFRIDKLASLGDGETAHMEVSYAAKGLALSRPVEAVPHLISAATEHPTARADIVVVLAGYGDDALSGHGSELVRLLEHSDFVRPKGALADAVSRLETFGRVAPEAEPR